METASININVIRLKDQQCARLSVQTTCTLKSLAVELEKAGLVENTSGFDNWVFLNKYNDECYQITDDPLNQFPIKNNGTLYVLDSVVAPNVTANYQALVAELEKLRQENQSLRKAIDLLSRNM